MVKNLIRPLHMGCGESLMGTPRLPGRDDVRQIKQGLPVGVEKQPERRRKRRQ